MLSLLFVWLQIILEMIPVSSSGQIVLLQKIGLSSSLSEDFFSAMIGASHLPTVLIIAIVFRAQWISLLKNPLGHKKAIGSLALATVITALTYFVVIKRLPFDIPALWQGFLVTTLILMALWLHAKQYANNRVSLTDLTIADGVCLGMAQSVALLPGTSRLGTTYLAARSYVHLEHTDAYAASFFIAAPLMLARGIQGCMQLKAAGFFTMISGGMMLGGFISIVAATTLAWFLFFETDALLKNGTTLTLAVWTGIAALIAYTYR